MDQELEYLRSQLEQQQSLLSSLTDRITSIDHSVTYSAGTSDAEESPLVRLWFFNEHIRPLAVAADSDQSRWKALIRELDVLKRSVNDANAVLHLRIDEERSTSLSTMENLGKGVERGSRLRGSGKEPPKAGEGRTRSPEEAIPNHRGEVVKLPGPARTWTGCRENMPYPTKGLRTHQAL